MGADQKKTLSPREVMGMFVGSWNSEMTYMFGDDPAKYQVRKMTSVLKWSPEKHFVLEQVNTGRVWVLTYDPTKKKHRLVVILPETTIILYGSWDDAQKSMSWQGHDDDGNRLKGYHRVLDKDHHKWELSVSKADQLSYRLAGKQKRRIKPGNQAIAD